MELTGEQEDALLADISDYLDVRGPGTPVGAETTIEMVAAAMNPDEDLPPVSDVSPPGTEEVQVPATTSGGVEEGKTASDEGIYIAPSGKRYPRKVFEYGS